MMELQRFIFDNDIELPFEELGWNDFSNAATYPTEECIICYEQEYIFCLPCETCKHSCCIQCDLRIREEINPLCPLCRSTITTLRGNGLDIDN